MTIVTSETADDAHARIHKVLSEGYHTDNVFLFCFFRFLIWWDGEKIECHLKWAIIGPPARWRADNGPQLNVGLVALGF